MCYCHVLLVYAVMKTLHLEKNILTEEECERVGEAGFWWYELVLTISVKPPDVRQLVIDVLEEYKKEWWYRRTANPLKS